MGRYRMDRIKDGGKTYYIIRHKDDMSLVIAPTKIRQRQTGHRILFAGSQLQRKRILGKCFFCTQTC